LGRRSKTTKRKRLDSTVKEILSFYKKGVIHLAVKTFLVERYKVALGHGMTATWSGTNIKARGYVACYGGDHRFIAYFLTDDSPVPNPVYVVQNKVGAIFVPFKEMQPFVDLLRNEKPIYAYLNSNKPEWNNIKTSLEPIGEEET